TLAFTNDLVSLQVVTNHGDTYPELVIAETDEFTGSQSFRAYRGGPAGFGAEQVLADAVEFQSFSDVADLNNDGLLDVVSFNTHYVAKAGGGLQPGQRIWVGDEGARHVADFNRDGKPDLLNGLSILLQK